MSKEKKEILALILISIEFIISCVFLVLYIKVHKLFFVPCVAMLFGTLITIHAFGLDDKVKGGIKKVAKVVFELTIGVIIRVFDALLNMTTANRTSDLKVIKGYEDKVFSVRERKKKRKASYKSYRLMDNREKVRFLYYKAVTKAVRKGFFFKGGDTPLEVNCKLIKAKYIKADKTELGEIYSLSRYDSESNITDEMVNVVKETY